MANYFRDFPKINYKFADGTTQTLADINIKYQLSDVVLDTSDVFYKYTWRDSDKPDSLADKYYDNSDYYWLVLQSNKIYDINYELPFNEEEFNEYLFEKYKDNLSAHNIDEVLIYTTDTVHHYEDKDGYIIDQESFMSTGGKSVTIYDYEFQENENKRNIKLIEYTRSLQIKNELDQKLKQLKVE